ADKCEDEDRQNTASSDCGSTRVHGLYFQVGAQASRVRVRQAPAAKGTIVQTTIRTIAVMSEMEALPALGSRRLSAAPSSTESNFPVWSSTGATASCQARRTPIEVARESSSEETPSARRKASVD